MAAMTDSGTPSAAAQRSEATSNVIPYGLAMAPQHTRAAGSAHQEGSPARDRNLAQNVIARGMSVQSGGDRPLDLSQKTLRRRLGLLTGLVSWLRACP